MKTKVLLKTVLFLALASLPVRATTVFNWAAATITPTDSTHVTVTGFTSGDFIRAYTVTITLAGGSTLDITKTDTGNTTSPLNINVPAGRDINTLATVTITLNSGELMGAPSFQFLDVDVSPSASDFSDWQDRVIVLTSGVSMSSVNTSYTTVTGSTVVGINGNVPNNSNNGNVNVSFAGNLSSIQFTYGPGPGDGFDNNQRIGIGNITLQTVTSATAPEPGTWVLISSGLILVGAAGRRRRRS
jgi:hypothetical protein